MILVTKKFSTLAVSQFSGNFVSCIGVGKFTTVLNLSLVCKIPPHRGYEYTQLHPLLSAFSFAFYA